MYIYDMYVPINSTFVCRTITAAFTKVRIVASDYVVGSLQRNWCFPQKTWSSRTERLKSFIRVLQNLSIHRQIKFITSIFSIFYLQPLKACCDCYFLFVCIAITVSLPKLRTAATDCVSNSL